ncbi:MAG: hypothetical protein COA69_11265 [Robiginitomaculum sp.]|nr:MAG: hypothetical protein COA69_11265 [Robiginitomaculum sp.]
MNMLFNLRKICISTLFGMGLLFTTPPAQAQQAGSSQNLQAMMDRWARQNPGQARRLEVAKKKAEAAAKKDKDKAEKHWKKVADDSLQSSFDTVFGEGTLKPSAAYDYLQVLEAVSAGDYKVAGELSTGLLIAAYAPGLGQYIKVMKFSHAQMQKQITRWGNMIYQTDSFRYFMQEYPSMTSSTNMYNDSHGKYPTYVPSYMITYLRNDPDIGARIAKIYDAMIARENKIFQYWSTSDEDHEMAVHDLQFGKLTQSKSLLDFFGEKGVESQWIVLLGKPPSDFKINGRKNQGERKMFNHFLYKYTADKKPEYMKAFTLTYIAPILKAEAAKEQRRLDAAVVSAMENTIAAILKEAGIDAEAEKAAEEEAKAKAEADAEAKAEAEAKAKAEEEAKAEAENAAIAAKAEVQDVADEEEPVVDDEPVQLIETPDTQNTIDNMDLISLMVATQNRGDLGPDGQEALANMLGNAFDMELSGADIRDPAFMDDMNIIVPMINEKKNGILDAEGQDTLSEYLGYEIYPDAPSTVAPVIEPPVLEQPVGEDDGDDWGDTNDIDSFVGSALSEDEQWAARDELAEQSKRDAERADALARQQYASAEAYRAEQRRIKEEKARKFREGMAILADGLNQVATQIQETKRQDAFETEQRQQNAQDALSTFTQQSDGFSKFMNSCRSQSRGGPFPNLDPNSVEIGCRQKYAGSQGRGPAPGDSYADQLEKQRRDQALLRAEDQRKLEAERRAALARRQQEQREARERARAQAQCACYQSGKSAGAAHDDDAYQTNTSRRPQNCIPQRGMGNVPPWAGGYYDGKSGNSQYANSKKWCRFGR